MRILIREVQLSDAEAIIGILNPIIKAGKYTVLDTPLTVEDERNFIADFPKRGIFHVAERTDDVAVVGFQSIEPFATYTHIFDHVGVIGTYVSLPLRRQGIGTRLAQSTFEVAKKKAFEKIFTYILSSNKESLAFHIGLGFSVIGTAKKQAKFGDRYEDEILVEKFLIDD